MDSFGLALSCCSFSKRERDPTIRVYLCELQGCVWLVSAQHEVVLMQLAFRFPANVETRQLIPVQWEDYINGFLLLGFKLLQFLGKGNAIQRFRVYLCGSEGGMWLLC